MQKLILLMIIAITITLFIGCSPDMIDNSVESDLSEEVVTEEDICDNDIDCSNNQVCENAECVELTPEITCKRKNMFWCEESGTCYPLHGIYCEQCLKKEIDWCSCRDEKSGNLKKDGEACFASSNKGEVEGVMMGKCVDGICKRELTWVTPEGKVHIGIIEFEPKGLVYAYLKNCNGNLQDDAQPCNGNKEYDYLDLINNKNGVSNVDFQTGLRKVHSFYFIEDWFEKEAEIYNIDLDIEVDVLGPYSLRDEPPRAFDYPAKDHLHQFFKDKASENNIELDSYDIIVFVYFYDFKDERKFHSHHTSPNIDYVSAPNSIWAVIDENILTSVMHEIGHSFGGADYYDGWKGCTTKGTPNEPHMACLMCSSCPNGDCGWDENNPDPLVTQLKICKATAEEEFEWI